MKCNILRNRNGEIDRVLAPNGKSSLLYQKILKELPDSIDLDSFMLKALQEGAIKSTSKEEIAAAAWLKTKTDKFKKIFKDYADDNNGEKVFQNALGLFNPGNFSISSHNELGLINDAEISEEYPQIERQLNDFLSQIGVDVKTVDKIIDRNGNEVSAYGKTSIINQVIELVENRRSTTFSEEAAHMITLMLGPNSRIVSQMMSDVTAYPEYADVRQKYKDQYKSEADMRMEAIGKVISKLVIEKQYQQTPAKSWFDKVLILLKRMFNKGDIQQFQKNYTDFQRIADAMMGKKDTELVQSLQISNESQYNSKLLEVAEHFGIKEDGYFSREKDPNLIQQALHRKGIFDIKVKEEYDGYTLRRGKMKVIPGQELFDLKDASQDIISEKILESKSELKDNIDIDGLKQRYRLIDDFVLQKRVSDEQTKLINAKLTPSEIEERENSFYSKMARESGTKGHSYNEQAMNYLANKLSNLETGFDVDTSEPNDKIDGFSDEAMYQLKIATTGVAKAIQKIQKEIDPSKNAKVFTEAFIMDKDKGIGGTVDLLIVFSDGSVAIYDYKFINFFKNQDSIPFVKERSYDAQISTYKNILSKLYGIQKFRKTRIIPFNINYESLPGKGYTGKVESLESAWSQNADNKLYPLPVAREMKNIDYMDNILNLLFNEKEKLIKKLKENYTNDSGAKYKVQLDLISESIKEIQMFETYDTLFKSINNMISSEKGGIEDMTYENTDELLFLLEQTMVFEPITNELELNYDKDKSIQKNLRDTRQKLSAFKLNLERKIEQVLLDEFYDLDKTEKKLTYLDATTAYTSEIDNSAFRALSKTMNTVNENTNRRIKQFAGELEEKHEDLQKWASSQGLTVYDAFDKLMNESGNLTSKFTQEFHKTQAEQLDKRNTKWFHENYELVEDYDEIFREKRAVYEKIISRGIEKNSQFYINRMQEWDAKHDIKNYPDAILNNNARMSLTKLKNEDKFYSSKYREIRNTPELAAYYDFYEQSNGFFNTLVDNKIKRNFIANVRKSANKILRENHKNNGLFSNVKEILTSLVTTYEEEGFVTDDSNSIPLLYTTKIRNKDGKIDNNLKSRDLTNNLLLFANSVFKKHELEKVDSLIQLMKHYVAKKKVYQTNNFGKPIFENEIPKLEDDMEKTVGVLDTHIKYYFQNKRIQSEDAKLGIISRNKALEGIHKFFAFNTLALSYVSATANALGGTANLFIKGSTGKYYNQGHVANSIKWLVSKSENGKAWDIAKYFDVSNPQAIEKISKKMSSNNFGKKLTMENAFALWKKPDDFIDTMTLISMSQNYGISEDGKVKRLEHLPEGSQSIYDSIEVKDGKVNTSLTPEQYDNFKKKVAFITRRLKGTNNTAEISAAQTNIFFKMFLFFKNWLPPMARERFDSIKYVQDLDEFEYGRFRGLVKTMVENKVKSIPQLIGQIIGLKTLKVNEEAARRSYEKFLEKNPHLQKEDIDFDDYIQLRKETITQAISELRMVAASLTVVFGSAQDWDDDDIADYKQYKLAKEIHKISNRLYLELSFFTDPTSVTSLVQDPLVIISLFVDLMKATKNGISETLEALELKEKSKYDNSPYLHYSKKVFTPLGPIFKFMEDFQEEVRE